MKLYQIDKEFGIDELKLVEKDEPKPKHQQVVVRMRAASVNYRDLLMIKGLYNPNLLLPLIPFSDGAGEVVTIGSDVTRWKPGDRVMSAFFQKWISGPLTDTAAKSALGGNLDGVLAEYVALHEDGLVAIPDHLSFEEGSTLPCAGLTAWHTLSTGGFTCGDTVLTLGTGGVSVFAVQLGKAAGAKLIGTSSSDEKLERLREMGVTEGINYKTEPDWDKKVLELTGGVGVDRVIEVGGAGTLAKSLKAVRVGGHISLIGVLTGQKGEINPLPAIMKSVRIQGILVGSREMFEALTRAVTVHRITPVIDRIFPFSDVKEALHYMSSAAHFGKVVVQF
jgi:NADPH:quinone reductase-like Zn-dependent oxidoreductase